MCAKPVVGSTVSLLKSSRLRFEFGSTQKMPRLQMSPTCIGVVGTAPVVHVSCPGAAVRLSDCPASRFQLQVGGYVLGLPLPGPAQPPGSNFPSESVGSISFVRSQLTSTLPGSPAAIVGKTSVCGELDGSTSYAAAALPGIVPPPPSQVLPPSLD